MNKRLMLAALCGCAYTALDKKHGLAKGYSTSRHFTDAVVVDQNGTPKRFYSDLLAGKVVVINMMYTACSGICPANTQQLLEIHTMLGSRAGHDVHLYSLTLRPDMDTPAALLDYAKKYHVTGGWSFLTGAPDDMDTIRRSLGFFDTDPVADADLANHTGSLRIGNVARDRWLMMPSAVAPRLVVGAIDNIS
jgi:protein SCO1/2